jgi:three-Cys-motif partner protein
MSKHDLEIKEKNIRRLLIKDPTSVPDVHYDGHTWSLVKLALLGQWAYVYTAILAGKWRSGIRYVDLLAGSGTTKVRETGDLVWGSPFIVKESASAPFDDYILVENNSLRYAALVENSKQLGNITKPKLGDCNKYVKEIFSDQQCHSLVFIDMEGFDLTWSNMEQIVKSKSDIIINFPTASFDRAAGLEDSKCLDAFFGDHSWFEKALTRQDFLILYMEKLARTFCALRGQEPYVEAIRVGNFTYFYDMILLCKKGKYVDVWGDYLKSRWDWQKQDQITHLLDYLKGREKRLDFFSGLEEKMSSIKQKRDDSSNKEQKQKESLTRWLNR